MRYVGIDLSTKTGLVILDKSSQVVTEKEITSNASDPLRMIEIIESLLDEIKITDLICVEGFSYGSRGRGVSFQFGLGHALRIELYKNNFNYLIVTPSQVKKYATGKGNTSKDNMILPIFKKWGFEHDSDNVRDAFVLAKIAEGIRAGVGLTNYQKDVIKAVE